MPVMRRTATAALSLVAAVGLLTACSSGGEERTTPDEPVDEWTTVTDQSSGVSVDLPGDADEQSLDVPLPDGRTMPVDILSVTVDEEAALSFAVYTPPDGAAAFDLAGAAHGSADQAGGTLTASVPTTYQGREALDSEMSVTSNGVEGLGLMRLVKVDDGHVVLLQAVGPVDSGVRELFDQMVPTLELAA